jgi:hypothetical protein
MAEAAIRAGSPAPTAIDVSHLTLDDIFLSYMEEPA